MIIVQSGTDLMGNQVSKPMVRAADASGLSSVLVDETRKRIDYTVQSWIGVLEVWATLADGSQENLRFVATPVAGPTIMIGQLQISGSYQLIKRTQNNRALVKTERDQKRAELESKSFRSLTDAKPRQ